MNENESSAALHQEEVDALDVHAQGCETTALLGCSLCIIWLNREASRLEQGHAALKQRIAASRAKS